MNSNWVSAQQLFNFQKDLVKFNHDTLEFFNNRLDARELLKKLNHLKSLFMENCADFENKISPKSDGSEGQQNQR